MRNFRSRAIFTATMAYCLSGPALAQSRDLPDWQSLTSEEAIAGCDKYAAHPSDPMKPDNVPGVASDADVAHDTAHVYCSRAFALNPKNPRLAFQNGRVNHARNPYLTGQPLQMFKIAQRGGSEIAGKYIAKLFPKEGRKQIAQANQRRPTTQRSGLSSWFNGLAMEIGRLEASYNRVAGGISCCADTKQQVVKKFPSIRTSIQKANRRTGRGKLFCSSMDLLELEVGYLKSWLGILSLESKEPKNRGSIKAAGAASLKALIGEADQNMASIKVRAAQAGCGAKR